MLDAAVQCFWAQGFETTSIRDLMEKTGLTAASLYNAWGDKRAIYLTALDRYVENSIGARIRRCEALPPREALHAFFAEILRRSLTDREHKGCLVVNSALEMAPRDPDIRRVIAGVLVRIETFFRSCAEAGQQDGTITRATPAKAQAQHLLGVLMGVRVLARVRPEKALLQGVVGTALASLDAQANGGAEASPDSAALRASASSGGARRA
ncbi:MAG: TetR family transcriptional regulator [Rhodospirillales bacterium 69-11]|nr:MAG: TetR family transcriptional regulator [Rhodospirillales bacterium 69-11]